MSDTDIYWPQPLEERFRLLERLDSGRMSTVVHAMDTTREVEVAIKVLHRHLADEEPIRRRLRRQLAAVRRLDHSSVVRIHELIEQQQLVALVMEYVRGQTVRQRVHREGPMDWESARVVLDSVLAGLQQAHDRGIWHRNLSAEHVFIDEHARGRIGGFGLARVDELVALTMHTRLLGSLEAMAPERLLGLDYDGRADLYSVGAVAYELLVGHPPVDPNLREAFDRAQRPLADPIADLPDELPEAAKYLLQRSLIGDAAARFATAGQMRRALHGKYDQQMWHGWTSRTTEDCPRCQAPVIDGVRRCVICDYQFRRLVQHPGKGDWMVRVVSPHEAFEPEVWFESNMEPKYLSEEQFGDLMQLLEAHEDTEPLANRDWEYRWPPYVLLSDLTREDARRVSRKLHKCSIPHELTRRLPGAMQTAFSGSGRSTGAMVGIALVLVTGILTAHVNVPVPDGVAIAGFFVFIAALLASQLSLVPLKRRLGSREDVPRRRGHAFMIPTRALKGQTRGSDIEVLPPRTGDVLEGLDDEAIRREVFEILVLAVHVGEEADEQGAELITALLQEVLQLAELLDGLRDDDGRRRTVELIERHKRIELQLERCDDESQRRQLLQRRQECLEALEDHDRSVFQQTMLRSRLVTVRATLLDLRGDTGAAGGGEFDEQVVLDFDERTEENLQALNVRLQAVQEAEALVK